MAIENYNNYEQEQTDIKKLREEAKNNRDKLKQDEIKHQLEISKEKERKRNEEELKKQQEKEMEKTRKDNLVKEFLDLTGLNDENPARFYLNAYNWNKEFAIQH